MPLMRKQANLFDARINQGRENPQDLSHLAANEKPLLESKTQTVRRLRRSRDNAMRGVENVFAFQNLG